MKKQNFNLGWTIAKGSGSALSALLGGGGESSAVTLPHDAVILNERSKDLPSGNGVAFFPYETVHYTKTFTLDDMEEGSVVWLEFGGV